MFMLSKKEVKYIQSLYHKKLRNVQGVFIAEGVKLADELLNSHFRIVHLYALEEWLETRGQLQVPVTTITADELARISQLATPNQVLIVAQMQHPAGPPTVHGQITLVLDGIQDPGNMGTIIRIADWFGITQIVCSPDCADKYNAKVVQASMGSICRVQSWYLPLDEWLTTVHVPVYGGQLNGASVYEAGKTAEGILVIGNESKGISPEVKKHVSHPVTIPRLGNAESLNAAVATGIILSHICG